MPAMTGADPVLIRIVSAVIVIRSAPLPTATVCGSTNVAAPVMRVIVSAPLRAS